MIVAWHGDPALKAEVVERMRLHREHDEIVQGLYQLINPKYASGYKGCLIGCTLPPEPIPAHEHVALYHANGGVEPSSPAAGWHGRVEQLYGIPKTVGHLLDKIFENLPVDGGQHAWFAVASLEAVPVGADLTMVPSLLMLDILAHPERGFYQRAEEIERPAVGVVAELYRQRIAGDEPSPQEWSNAQTYARQIGCEVAADAVHAAISKDVNQYAETVDFSEDFQRPYTWWPWVAERLVHYLAAAPIPVKI